MTKLLICKFIKYCAVGFSGVVVDFLITWLLKEKLRLNKYIANTAGFVSAASSNYILNRIWTFESDNPQIAVEYLSFFIISLIGLGLNNLIIWFCADKMKWNFYVSKLVAIGVVTFWNFVLNYLFTFSDPRISFI